MRRMHDWARLNWSDSSRSASAFSESLWMAQRSREEMEGLRRSSRRALERGGNGQWAIGNGEEGEGEVGRPPPSRLRRATSPGSPGEERLNALSKSYSGNRFDVCMWELSQTAWAAQVRVGVVRGCCARSGRCGVRLRTNREIGAGCWVNGEGAEGLKRGYAEVAESAEDAEKRGWDAGGVLGCCLCLGCLRGVGERMLLGWDAAYCG